MEKMEMKNSPENIHVAHAYMNVVNKATTINT